MVRLLGAFLFLAVCFCVTTDCNAQHFRGRFRRNARLSQARPHQESVDATANDNSVAPPRYRHPAKPRFYESRYSHATDPTSAFPKYIGGFHASHYYNLGIPTGDLGFRGNGVYWAPW